MDKFRFVAMRKQWFNGEIDNKLYWIIVKEQRSMLNGQTARVHNVYIIMRMQ